MANLEKTVEIIFAGVDKTSSIFSSVGKKLDQFSGKVQNVAQPLSNVADDVLKLDTALVTLAAAGLAVAINESGKFSDSFNEITTLIDDTGQGVDKFRGDILDYARDSKKSMEDIISSLYAAKSAGVEYTYTLETLSDAEKLSIAGKAGLEASTKTLVSSLNAYGESTSEATRYSDILFKTVKLGQTTLPELSTSLSSVTNIAVSAGIPFETLAAAIAAVTATGMPTSQAITSIKAAINAIIKPSSQAAKEAKNLEIGFNAAALKSEGFEKILWKVHEATGGSADKMAILYGSVEALPVAMALGSDSAGRFRKALDEMANATGATEVAYKKMVDNFELINQNLANNVRVTFIQVGLKLQDNYTDIVKNISEVFKSVGVSIDQDAFNKIFTVLDAFGVDIAKFFSELAKSLPEALNGIKWDGFLSALDELGLSIGGLFDNFDPSDPESVRDAIQFVVESLETLIRVSKGMVDSFEPMIKALLNSADAFNRMDDADKEATGNVLGLAKALTTLGTGLTTIMLLIGDNADAIKSAFTVVAGAIELGYGALKTGIQTISIAVLEGIDNILKAAELVTFGSWDEKIKEARGALAVEMVRIMENIDGSATHVRDGWVKIAQGVSDGVGQVKKQYAKLDDPDLKATPILETRTFEENLAIVASKMREFEKSGEPIEIVATNFKALETFQQTANAWDVLSFDAAGNVKVNTNFNQIQNDWESITSKFNAGGDGHEIAYKTIYKWTDASGTPHITDTPPDLGEAIGDVEEIKAPIKADVDDKSIRAAQNRIKSAFTKSSMGPINLPISFGGEGGSGMGGITDKFKDAFKQTEPIPVDDLVDMSGIAELLDSIKGMDSPTDRGKMKDAAMRMMESQRKVVDTEQRNLAVRTAIAEKEWRTANMTKLSGEQENVIKIEAAGLEPHMEAFMWQLLKKIQIRANKSSAEFLLAAKES